jgi:hypothetical protein
VLDSRARDIGIGERTHPHAVVAVEVVELAVVTLGNEADLTHAGHDVLEEHADGQQVVVGGARTMSWCHFTPAAARRS